MKGQTLRHGGLLLTGVLLLQLLIAPLALAQADQVQVRASDTIAGYPTTLKSSIMTPGELVNFRIQKPDGSVLELDATANDRGVAEVDLLGFHTTATGQYNIVAARSEDQETYGPGSVITVYPDVPSPTHSYIQLQQESVTANGSEEGSVRVILKDKYGNPIPDHAVELISSRLEDEIYAPLSKRTDQEGIARISILSQTPGVSTLSARDTTAGVTIQDRAELVFFRSVESNGAGTSTATSLLGANLLGANAANTNGGVSEDSFGPAVRFQVDFPDSVEANSDQNFLTITALDAQGQVSRNYTGTIIISTPNDPNVQLPSGGQYTFSSSDQGVARFDLALVFRTVGTQQIQVNDISDGSISPFLSGEKFVTVREACVGSECVVGSGSQIIIESPQEGEALSVGRITITGQARPNINLVVQIDGTNIGIIEVEPNGRFAQSFESIAEGDRTLRLVEQSSGQESSEAVNFVIDTTPPTLTELNVAPDGVVPGGSRVDITVLSEPDLETVSVRLAGIIEELVEDEGLPGNYRASFVVPQDPGQYPLLIRLQDNLGNRTERSDVRSIQVGAPEVLPVVGGIDAQVQDQEIRLSWDPLQNEGVAGYRILLGNDEFLLNGITDVAADATEYTLSDLAPETQYYVNVAAVDEAGVAGLQNTPLAVYVGEQRSPDPLSSEIIGGRILQISWQEYPGSDVSEYELRLGLSSGGREITRRFPSSARITTFEDLIPEIPYFVSLVAINEDGQEMDPPYEEIRVTLPPRENTSIPALPPALGGNAGEEIDRSPVIITERQQEEIGEVSATGTAGMSTIFMLAMLTATGFYMARRKYYGTPDT